MWPRIACLSLMIFPAAVRAQTQIGGWKFQEALASPTPGVYFIESSRGDPSTDFFTTASIYCDHRRFTLHILLPSTSRPGPMVPRSGWTVSLHLSDGFVGEIDGTSDGEEIVATLPDQILKAISSTRGPTPSLTVGIERSDFKDVIRVFSYPATESRKAVEVLAASCR